MKTPMWTKSWLTMLHLIKQKLKLKDDAAIGHFRVPKPLLQNEDKCTVLNKWVSFAWE